MRRMPVASAGAARRAARAHGAAACWVMCGIGDRAAGLARCARRAHPMWARLRRLRVSLRGRPGVCGEERTTSRARPQPRARVCQPLRVRRCAAAGPLPLSPVSPAHSRHFQPRGSPGSRSLSPRAQWYQIRERVLRCGRALFARGATCATACRSTASLHRARRPVPVVPLSL